jgi:hypothetical protein
MLRYRPDAFSGMSKAQFIRLLSAEGISPASEGYPASIYGNPMFLEKRMWGGACPLDCPRYGRDIDYSEFAAKCPVAERACATEAVWLLQNALMAGEEEVHAIARTIEKIQRRSAAVCS